jgi:BirA family transcriptional regulator, biotin operon repressor / biotin---[acetyl-CoA-carboxylase] ligase
MGYKFVLVDQTESTNDDVRAILASDSTQDVVVRAKMQTRGRGRRGRHWDSPPGNLYFSFSKTPPVDPAVLGQISLVVGLAVYRVIRTLLPSPVPIALKWPNDILVNQMKVGGILVETEPLPGRSPIPCIIGIGINILSSPEGVTFPSCALRDFMADCPDPDQLVRGILREFEASYQTWIKDGFDTLRSQWLDVSYGLGKSVSAKSENGLDIDGRFLTLSSDGAVIIRRDDGTDYVVHGSDITYTSNE